VIYSYLIFAIQYFSRFVEEKIYGFSTDIFGEGHIYEQCG